MDVVLIPCYMRPEYLALCLEHLAAAEGSRADKEYWVCQDMRFEDDCRYGMQLRWTKEVIDNARLPVRYIQRKPHGWTGNSYNTMEAYKEAISTDVRYVYLVEEDVLVTPDFFRWHEAVQAVEPNTMCSVAYRCSRNREARTDIVDPAAYFTTERDYASIGVCWKKDRLSRLASHSSPAYFADSSNYIQRTFPGNRFAGDFCEQDGLIMRLMWEERAFTSWPYVPRCYHMGWYGYHRPNGKRPEGQLGDKVARLRSLLRRPEELRIVAPDFGDIEAYDDRLNQSFGVLYKEQHFS
jgi:hypothetical protein